MPEIWLANRVVYWANAPCGRVRASVRIAELGTVRRSEAVSVFDAAHKKDRHFGTLQSEEFTGRQLPEILPCRKHFFAGSQIVSCLWDTRIRRRLGVPKNSLCGTVCRMPRDQRQMAEKTNSNCWRFPDILEDRIGKNRMTGSKRQTGGSKYRRLHDKIGSLVDSERSCRGIKCLLAKCNGLACRRRRLFGGDGFAAAQVQGLSIKLNRSIRLAKRQLHRFPLLRRIEGVECPYQDKGEREAQIDPLQQGVATKEYF